MSDAYTCPMCEYGAPTAGSVKAHITRKTTGEHEGESGPDYSEDEMLSDDRGGHPDYGGDPLDDEQDRDEGDDTVTDAGDDRDSDSAPEQPTETAAAPEDSEASTDGGSGIVPEADAHSPPSDSADDGSDPTECPNPDCENTEHFRDADDHLDDYRDRLESQHVEALESGSHVCQVCGGVF